MAVTEKTKKLVSFERETLALSEFLGDELGLNRSDVIGIAISELARNYLGKTPPPAKLDSALLGDPKWIAERCEAIATYANTCDSGVTLYIALRVESLYRRIEANAV